MSEHPVKRRKKLIEVAIPLEAINAASAREKSIRHGHPSTLHLWWARRPLAAARSVIFCQMVDDPSAVPEEFPTEEDQEKERLRLFALISELVQWENTTNEEVLNRARGEILRSWRRCCTDNADHPEAAELFNPEKLPGFHDPFAGGGALPLEAQRLGLEAFASDLNPVAVLINKTMIEIPGLFCDSRPVNPESAKKLSLNNYTKAEGLAEDVAYYGKWIGGEARRRLEHLYPSAEVTDELILDPGNPRKDLAKYKGRSLPVIAWLWARTVKSPNPAFQEIDVPLASTFLLSSSGKSHAYIVPIVGSSGYRITVCTGRPPDPQLTKAGLSAGKWNAFKCLMSGSPISYDYIRAEGVAGRMGLCCLGVVAQGDKERVYLPPSASCNAEQNIASQGWFPELEINHHPRDIKTQIYGITRHGQLFTPRQLVLLSTLGDLVGEANKAISIDAQTAGMSKADACRYSDSVCTYLGQVVSKMTSYHCTLGLWRANQGKSGRAFGRQAIPMVWDFPECSPFAGAGGDWDGMCEDAAKVVRRLGKGVKGVSNQHPAQLVNPHISTPTIVSTDPPYYDNVGYADLSDFFYVWLRRTLSGIYPDLFATMAVPKAEELVATPYRHGGKESADNFFLEGMVNAMKVILSEAHPAFPCTIYYAFKQAEGKSGLGFASTGWESFLEAVVIAGFEITGTLPIRTEQSSALKSNYNSLASSIVLVCNKRPEAAFNITRSDFRRKLRYFLPRALRQLERANIAPVDVAQAAIGPGMAIYSSAKAVLNPDDSPMSVREALIEINTALDEYLSQDEGDLDADSRFALTFFESYGYEERPYGDAEGLAIARNLSVDGVAEAGILYSVAGKVRLYQRAQLPDEWDPVSDRRLCVWEATQHLIKRLEASGEGAAAELLLQLKSISGHGDLAANCRALAYRLYNHCEKKKQAEEARSYNGLVIAWPELERLASASSTSSFAPRQTTLI